MTQTVKNLPAMQNWVRSLGWEDPLEEGMATHSSILAWKIPMDRGAWQATVHRVAKSRTQLSDYAHSTSDPETSVSLEQLVPLMGFSYLPLQEKYLQSAEVRAVSKSSPCSSAFGIQFKSHPRKCLCPQAYAKNSMDYRA